MSKKEIKVEELENVAGGWLNDKQVQFCDQCQKKVVVTRDNVGTTCYPDWHYTCENGHEWDD